MQLFYRGAAYERRNSMIEVTETQQEGLFLANRFNLKQCTPAQRHSQPAQLKYRGVVYSS